MLFGGQDDGALRAGNYTSLDRIKSMGGNQLRVIISRERVGKEGWKAFDNLINEAHAKGINTQVVLDNKEGFKGGGQGDPNKYAQFVKQAAQHLKGRVGTYSLVNEPDLKMNPQKYRELFVRGQKALSGVDNNARVLFGEFSPHGGLDYAKKVVGKRGVVASGVAIHPYQSNDPLAAPDNGMIPWGIGKGRTMQKDIAAMNIKTRAKKTPGLYYTEFGYDSKNPNAAAYWPRALQSAKRAGVKEVIAYGLTGTPPGDPNQSWDTGLFNPDGTPRSSYNAIMQARGR
jgi:hypothetical protein